MVVMVHVTVHPYAHPPHERVLIHIKMYLLDVGCSLKGFCSLNHSEVVSFIIFALTLSPTLSANFPKPRKSCDGGNGLSLHPHAHPPQDKTLQHLIFVSDICVGCNLRGSTASTIALWHHLNITLDTISINSHPRSGAPLLLVTV